jgi:hypothetical protein
MNNGEEMEKYRNRVDGDSAYGAAGQWRWFGGDGMCLASEMVVGFDVLGLRYVGYE